MIYALVLVTGLNAAWGRDAVKPLKSMPAISNSLVNLGKMDISFHFDGKPTGGLDHHHVNHGDHVDHVDHIAEMEPESCPCTTMSNMKQPFELINKILSNEAFNEKVMSKSCCESHEQVEEETVFFEFGPQHMNAPRYPPPAPGIVPHGVPPVSGGMPSLPFIFENYLRQPESPKNSLKPRAVEIFFLPKNGQEAPRRSHANSIEIANNPFPRLSSFTRKPDGKMKGQGTKTKTLNFKLELFPITSKNSQTKENKKITAKINNRSSVKQDAPKKYVKSVLTPDKKDKVDTGSQLETKSCPCTSLDNIKNSGDPNDLLNSILRGNNLFSRNVASSPLCCESHETIQEDTILFEFGPKSNEHPKLQSIPSFNELLTKSTLPKMPFKPKAVEIMFFPKYAKEFEFKMPSIKKDLGATEAKKGETKTVVDNLVTKNNTNDVRIRFKPIIKNELKFDKEGDKTESLATEKDVTFDSDEDIKVNKKEIKIVGDRELKNEFKNFKIRPSKSITNLNDKVNVEVKPKDSKLDIWLRPSYPISSVRDSYKLIDEKDDFSSKHKDNAESLKDRNDKIFTDATVAAESNTEKQADTLKTETTSEAANVSVS